MTETNTPFDHRPDPLLGEALRRALAPGSRAEFAARVLAAAERPADPLVDVLARWSRLGIAAALLAALATGILVGRGNRSTSDSIVSGADPEAVVAGVQMPEAGVLYASYSER